jgi:hypothetical protein
LMLAGHVPRDSIIPKNERLRYDFMKKK